MTTLLDRYDTQLGEISGSRLQLWARGALAAVSVMAVGVATMIVLALIAWAGDSRSTSTAGQATRVGISLWLLAFRAPLHVAHGTVSLPPLGLTLLAAWALKRSAGSLASWWRDGDSIDLRDDAESWPIAPSMAVEVIAAISLPFAIIATTLAVVAGMHGLQPSTAGAFAAATLVAVISTGVGVIRAGEGDKRLTTVFFDQLPQPVRTGLGGAGWVLLLLAVGGTMLVLGSLGWHVNEITASVHRAGGGIIGAVGLTLVCIVLLPNAVIAALGYLIGPGFSIGAGSSVGQGGVHLHGLPPLPLLAALPHGAAPIGVRLAIFALIGAAGIIAALLPWTGPESMSDALCRAGVASITASIGIAIVVALAGGPAGPGWLRTVGASGWLTGVALAAELLSISLVVAVGKAAWSVFVTRYDI